MKILIINSLYFPNVVGGAEKSVQLLAEALKKQGCNVCVATLTWRAEAYLQNINGVNVYYIPLENLYFPFSKNNQKFLLSKMCWHLIDIYNFRMIHKIEQVVKKIKPDIVHTNNLAGFSVGIWKVVKEYQIPIVHTLRDYYLLCVKSSMFDNKKNCVQQCAHCRFFSGPKKYLTKYVDFVTGVSDFILKYHIRHKYFENSKKSVIYNPCDMTTNSSLRRSSSRKRSAVIRLGYIGRIHPTKGVELLLHSFLKLPSNRVELWIAGKGDPNYEAKLRNMVQGVDNVHWLGFVSPRELMDHIDVLVVPSLWNEPMGRVVVEAYAHGVPVIGSNRGGIPELIIEGETGYIFNPDNPETLQDLVIQLMEHPEVLNYMRCMTRKMINNFSVERIVKEYLLVYKYVLQ